MCQDLEPKTTFPRKFGSGLPSQDFPQGHLRRDLQQLQPLQRPGLHAGGLAAQLVAAVPLFLEIDRSFARSPSTALLSSFFGERFLTKID